MEQARELANKLRQHSFALILSSPLGRAVQTAKILHKELRIGVIREHPDLMERSFGVFEGKTKEELLREFPAFWDTEGRFMHESEPPSGEPLHEFLARTRRVTEEIRRIAKEKSALIVTHDGVLHAIAAYLMDIRLVEVQKLHRFPHGEPIVFEQIS